MKIAIPKGMEHYVQNLGDEPLRYLEMFRSPRIAGVMAITLTWNVLMLSLNGISY